MPAIYLDFLKITLVFADLGVILAIAGYWVRARWYRNPIGIGLQGERFALVGTLGLVTTSVFFLLNRNDSLLIAWIQLGLICVIGLFNYFLFYVFERIHQQSAREIRREAKIPGGRHRATPGWRARLSQRWAKFFLMGSPDE